MKKLIYLLVIAVFAFTSCSDNNDDIDNGPQLPSVAIQLTYPSGSGYNPVQGVLVKVEGQSGGAYQGRTDANGKVTIQVSSGIYSISTTDSRLDGIKRTNFNGVKNKLVVSDSWNSADIQTIELQASKSADILIKELYVGGCPKDDGSGTFSYDKYVVLYNNSDTDVNIGKMGLAMAMPYNASASNSYYNADGELSYASEGWLPAAQGVWYFQQDLTLASGKQVVIALNNALNNTLTYSKSINFDNSEYYCTYDNSKYTHLLTYPAPTNSIPTTHYLKAVSYGAGNAWPLSGVSPAFFIFTPVGTTVKSFAEDVSNADNYGGSTMLASRKVPVEWVNDGIEVFTTSNSNVLKRLTMTVDAGYVNLTNSQGYSLYRNVDKEATESISGNKAKLVYNYSLGTTDINKGTTDPSTIDAEASIKNGARIVYLDTNNSSSDFHQRSKASLRN